MGNQNLLEKNFRSPGESIAGKEADEHRGSNPECRCKETDDGSAVTARRVSVCGPMNLNVQRFGSLIGQSRAMRNVFHAIVKTAVSKASVVIYGESGTGKELVAQAIHNRSPRCNNRFVPVNCGAIPSGLIESEFFGYKKGAFTGAAMDKPGFLDLAEGGTLFLDEVGELSPAMQVKLLRAIDGCGFTPIGSQVIKKPDFRIIAATNRDLRGDLNKGMMREDFYYRINILPIFLPSLRERKEDIPLFVNHFLERFSRNQDTPMIPSDLADRLKSYDWPGNIRELQNTIQRYIALKEIGPLGPAHKTQEEEKCMLLEAPCDRDLKSALDRFEALYIARCLKSMNWHKSKTCAVLKINRKTLYKKIRQYGLKEIYCV